MKRDGPPGHLHGSVARVFRSAAFLAGWLLAGVSVQAAAPTMPDWLAGKVEGYQAAGQAPERTVYQTHYQGRVAYWISAACCDRPSELYDATGGLLCYPDGGLAGGDGKCTDFTQSRPEKVRLWPDAKALTAPPLRTQPDPPLPKPPVLKSGLSG